MLSYRHGYHAGNHADILKHTVLCLILRNLNLKDKPYTIIDTHAGGGIYDLASDFAQKNLEFNTGLSCIKDHAALKRIVPEFYQVLEQAQKLELKNHGEIYPGSPFFECALSRDSDTIFLSDLHKAEFESLRTLFKRQRKVHIELRDGLAALKALLPPLKRRGVILIDPSYEMKSDYVEVIKAVKEIQQRFSQGIVAIWYPVLARMQDQSKMLVHQISRLKIPTLQVELRVAAQNEEYGMCGSGMIVVNPPYRLADEVDELTAALYHALAEPHGGSATWQMFNEELA